MSPREMLDTARKWKVNVSTAVLCTLFGAGLTIGAYKARFEDQQVEMKEQKPLVQQVPVLTEQVKLLQDTTSAIQKDQVEMKGDIIELKTSLDLKTKMILDKIDGMNRKALSKEG